MAIPSRASLQAQAEAGDGQAQLDLANALFRERRPAEALPWLQRSAQAGHPIAQTLLGARLLGGRSTAAGWTEGVGLLMAANEAGVADASNMLSVLAAMGAGVAQSWEDAFDLLQLAAERGSIRGRAQLLPLAREHGSTAGDEDWAALRSALSPDPWLSPPEPKVLSDSPYIATYKGFISPAASTWLVERARGRGTPAQVFDILTGASRTHPNRSNSAFHFNANIVELDLFIALVRARIAAALRVPPEHFEPPQVFNYQVGEIFAPHFDFLDLGLPGPAADVAQRGQRTATFLIYLNADYDGGETDFPTLGLRFRGEPGDALLFYNLDDKGDGDPRTLHAGLAPTRGEKWLFSQWVRDRPPNPLPERDESS